ncbi:MAG TPA: hypothetical protein VIU12_27615 [Chryseolinea sp.]
MEVFIVEFDTQNYKLLFADCFPISPALDFDEKAGLVPLAYRCPFARRCEGARAAARYLLTTTAANNCRPSTGGEMPITRSEKSLRRSKKAQHPWRAVRLLIVPLALILRAARRHKSSLSSLNDHLLDKDNDLHMTKTFIPGSYDKDNNIRPLKNAVI